MACGLRHAPMLLNTDRLFPQYSRQSNSMAFGRLAVIAVVVLAFHAADQAVAYPPITWPTASGVNISTTATIVVKANQVFDGKMARYYGIGDGSQSESQPSMFDLQENATLLNVIIGVPAGDGVHCLGSCTIRNVWWEDVGEDAATFKATAPTAQYCVEEGGARLASDKVFQFNGAGVATINNFLVEQFGGSGKLIRSCGNCKKQYKRTIFLKNIVFNALPKPSTIAGVNSNYGDVVTFQNITVLNDPNKKMPVCVKFKGNNKGKEPVKVGTGADGKNCIYTPQDVTYA